MPQRNTTIESVRDRLTGLLADWGAELSLVLKELEEKRARVAELEGGAAGREDELSALRKRVEGQDDLIETLQGDVEEASKLRQEIRSKDLDIERLRSELESKKELIHALRRDAEGADRLKADAKLKDREMADLRTEIKQARQHIEETEAELGSLRDVAAGQASEESAEIESLRAELEARKSLIKSLRSDQERAAALEASLEEKRETIEQLEAAINRNSNTIAELRRSAESWKHKYQSLKSDNGTATTAVNMPTLSDTDVRVIEQLEQTGNAKQDATIAIDMRRSLLEARRAAANGKGEK